MMDRQKIQALTPLAIALTSVFGCVIISIVPSLESAAKKEIAILLAGTGLAGACGLAQQVGNDE
ncbi:hypothetical protein AB3R30_18875 [Leptolyngbyaceae cyanobacterium UHCC 1019]